MGDKYLQIAEKLIFIAQTQHINKSELRGNFAIQNSDYVLSLGCHLSVSLTGFEYNLFARDAIIDVIDIDQNEHKKNTIKISNFILK